MLFAPLDFRQARAFFGSEVDVAVWHEADVSRFPLHGRHKWQSGHPVHVGGGIAAERSCPISRTRQSFSQSASQPPLMRTGRHGR